MIKKFIFLITVLFLILIPLKAQDYWNTHIISIDKNKNIEKKLLEKNFDFLMEWDNKVYFLVGLENFPKLHKENILYTLETYNFYPYRQREVSIQGGVNGDYHSYGELERELLALQDSYPDLVRVSVIGESLERRNIYAVKISDNVNLDEDEAEVIFIGCHHAREWISVEIPFLLGKYLAENYSINSQVKDLVDQSEIWIVPLLNPDGLHYSIHFYRWWRKNRRYNGDGTYGVDLNRNYGYLWGYDDEGSSPYTIYNDYRGTSAFSEPETQVIRDLFAQRNFKALISYHSHSQIILYPWGYKDQVTNQDALLEQIASDMSGLMQAVDGNVYEYGQAGEALYVTNGDTTDWAFGVYGIPSFTIELPPVDKFHGQFFNAEEEIQSIFNENLPAMLYLIDWSIQNSTTNNNSIKRITRRPEEKVIKKNNLLVLQDSLNGQSGQNKQDNKITAKSQNHKTERLKSLEVQNKIKNSTKSSQFLTPTKKRKKRLTKKI